MVLTLGVIGFEHGHIHSIVEGLLERDRFDLRAIAGRPSEKLEEAKSRYDVPAYEDYRRMLDAEAVDAVAIAPLNNKKAEVIVECASRGIHVFCDKPFWTTKKDQQNVAEILGETHIVLHGYLSMRFGALYHHLKKNIEEGRIGDVVCCILSLPHSLKPEKRDESVLDASINGGLMVDLGIHGVDTVRWLTDSEPAEVTAYTSNRRFLQFENFQDNAQVMMRMQSGAAGFVELDWLRPSGGGHQGIVRVTGTDGTVFIEDSEYVVTTSFENPPDRRRITPADAPEISNFEDFYLSITQDGYTPVLSNEDVLRSMEIVIDARDRAISRP